jgi:hypothetical protein
MEKPVQSDVGDYTKHSFEQGRRQKMLARRFTLTPASRSRCLPSGAPSVSIVHGRSPPLMSDGFLRLPKPLN